MWRHGRDPIRRQITERWTMLIVLLSLAFLYGAVAVGVTRLGATQHGRSLSVAGPIAILPR